MIRFYIRDMKYLDIDECTEIVRLNWDDKIAEQASNEMKEMFVSSTRWPPHYFVAVEMGSGRILGYAGFKAAWLMSNVYELIWINVRQEAQRNDIGRFLTIQRINEIKNRNGALIMLMSQKPTFFEQFGFKTVENIDGWMLMLKHLSTLRLEQRS